MPIPPPFPVISTLIGKSSFSLPSFRPFSRSLSFVHSSIHSFIVSWDWAVEPMLHLRKRIDAVWIGSPIHKRFPATISLIESLKNLRTTLHPSCSRRAGNWEMLRVAGGAGGAITEKKKKKRKRWKKRWKNRLRRCCCSRSSL